MDRDAIVVRRLPGVPLPDAFAPTAPASPPVASTRVQLFRTACRAALNLVFLTMIATIAIMLVPALLGFQRYVILTGSMTGTYNRGSIVFDRPVPVSQLRVGDPITYSPPPGFTSEARVTHRIWSIHRGVNGQRIFKTKGDANKHPDAWSFTLNQPTQDEVVFDVPDVGYVFLILSLRDFRFVLVGVPALIIGLLLLQGFWRAGGVEVRRQELARAGWQVASDPGPSAILPPIDDPLAERIAVWLDLPLRPVRASWPHAPALLPSNRRSCTDLHSLRVGRLTPAPYMGAQADDRGSSLAGEQFALGASVATMRLLVPRRASRAVSETAPL